MLKKQGLARMIKLLKALRRSEGNVATIFAMCLPVIIGGAGLGVETVYWYHKDLQLQAAADAAVYAAALEKRAGASSDAIYAQALDTASKNGFDSSTGTIEVNSPPLSGPNAGGQAVEVILDQPVERYFSRIFSEEPVVEDARAVALFQSAADACILALDPSASKAALFSGSSLTTLTNCAVMANSVADDAIKVQGSAQVSTDCLITAGGVSTTAGLTMTDCASAITNAPTAGDPFAGLATPTDAGPCKNDNGATLEPGNYCSGLSINSAKTLQPGTYIISGGDFKVNANANITGTGVTIYTSGTARVSMNGNATVNLSAPTSGTYSGVLFFGDRTNTDSATNTFNGTPSSHMTGAIYSANQAIKYLGNFSGTNGCTQIVGKTVEWNGNTTISSDCSAYGMKTIPASLLIYMAE
jgi:hypothetical protein